MDDLTSGFSITAGSRLFFVADPKLLLGTADVGEL